MKKFLLTLAAAAACFGAYATEVVFNLADPASFGITVEGDRYVVDNLEKDGVKLSVVHGEDLQDNAKLSFFVGVNGTDFRCGKSNKDSKMTISAAENISKIEFTGSATFAAMDGYAAGATTWTGSAKSVTFTTNGQVKLTQMVVTLGEGGGTVTPAAGASINESFASGIPSTWTNVKVSGDKEWYGTSYSGTYYAAMTGYKGTQPPFDAWLISPAVDMSKVADKKLTFRTQVNGYNSTTSQFKVYVLNSTDPATATKTELKATIAEAPASGYSAWVESGDIDLSSFTGTVYVAFQFYATEDANYATWCVTDVKLNANGVVPPTPVGNEFVSIADFLAARHADGTSVITCPLTVTYQNGRYLYLTDGKDVMLVYGDLKDGDETLKFVNGDILASGITGTYTEFKSLVQMGNPVVSTFVKSGHGAEVAPKTITASQVVPAMMNTLVELKNVNIEAIADKANNYNVTDNTGTILLYNQFANAQYYDAVEVTTGTGLDLVAIVTVYNDAAQLYPVKMTPAGSVEGIEAVNNAPVEYFNLQGIRVANPENGLYIRRQGNEVSKVFVR